MSTANATAQLSKSDNYSVAELRDPNKRTARLKWTKRELKFYAIGTIVLFVIAQVLIFAAIYGQLYKDLTAFLWATPFAIMFLGLCMLGYFQCSRAYADIKAIQVYEALTQDQSASSEK